MLVAIKKVNPPVESREEQMSDFFGGDLRLFGVTKGYEKRKATVLFGHDRAKRVKRALNTRLPNNYKCIETGGLSDGRAESASELDVLTRPLAWIGSSWLCEETATCATTLQLRG